MTKYNTVHLIIEIKKKHVPSPLNRTQCAKVTKLDEIKKKAFNYIQQSTPSLPFSPHLNLK